MGQGNEEAGRRLGNREECLASGFRWAAGRLSILTESSPTPIIVRSLGICTADGVREKRGEMLKAATVSRPTRRRG